MNGDLTLDKLAALQACEDLDLKVTNINLLAEDMELIYKIITPDKTLIARVVLNAYDYNYVKDDYYMDVLLANKLKAPKLLSNYPIKTSYDLAVVLWELDA